VDGIYTLRLTKTYIKLYFIPFVRKEGDSKNLIVVSLTLRTFFSKESCNMKETEILQIILAIMTLSILVGFTSLISFDYIGLGLAILFSFIIVIANVLGKKAMASRLDSGVEHQIWKFQRFGIKPKAHFKKSIPAGIIFPLFLTVISLGIIKLMTVLTYKTKALKRRAARRHGHLSFTEMTDFHNALVGAAGIIAVLLVSFIGYWFQGFETLSKLAAFYAFSNLLPFSKLDGTQIYFGSRVLWATLAVITLIFTSYALLLV
jgi:Zn-dependent protease